MASVCSAARPLRIGYSNWPSWAAWEIAIQKGWFAEEGVEVDFQWLDYTGAMKAYVEGELDGVSMTNGDMLVTGATGRRSVAIVINDFSAGNDVILAGPGIDSIRDLKGKKIGVEEGYVDHLLLLKALEEHGMTPADISLVNIRTPDTAEALASGQVDAIGTWGPEVFEAIQCVPGAKVLFSSRETPGLIYDLLCASPESLGSRTDEWAKVVAVWYRIVDFVNDPQHRDEAIQIMAARMNLKVPALEMLLQGTHILSLDQALEVWKQDDGLNSLYGSSKISDKFSVQYNVYEERQRVRSYLFPALTRHLAVEEPKQAVGKD